MNRDAHSTTLVLLPVALVGSLINWTVFYSIQKISTFKHAFGYLSANQAIADALHSTCFLFYFCPMVLLESESMKTYSYHAGFFLLFCYELSVLTHLLMSLNRFFAVFVPYHYQRIFSERNTKFMILAMWVFTGTIALWFYQYLCKFYYEEAIHFLTFTNSELCGFIGWYGDFLKNSFIVLVMVCIDLVTVVKVRSMSRKVTRSLRSADHLRFSRREKRFLRQTVFQGAVFLLELLTYFFTPKYVENEWIVFFATSFAWVSVHAADGLVVLAFNPEIRRFVVTRGKLAKLESASNTMATQKSTS